MGQMLSKATRTVSVLSIIVGVLFGCSSPQATIGPARPEFAQTDLSQATEKREEVDPKAAEWAKKSTDSLNKENWPEVITTASAAISIDSSFEEAYLNRGFAYYKQGSLDESIRDWNKAIELNPETPQGLTTGHWHTLRRV